MDRDLMNPIFDSVETGLFSKIVLFVFLIFGLYFLLREYWWKLKGIDRKKYYRPFWQEEEYGMIHKRVETEFGVVGSDGYTDSDDSSEDFISEDEINETFGDSSDIKSEESAEVFEEESEVDTISEVSQKIKEEKEKVEKPY